MSSSGENRIIQGTSFMYFDIKRMRAKDCWLLTGKGLLWSRLLAEVKREGFYEAVTADKVSLSPPQTGLFRYCTQVAVRQCTYTVALYVLLLSPGGLPWLCHALSETVYAPLFSLLFFFFFVFNSFFPKSRLGVISASWRYRQRYRDFLASSNPFTSYTSRIPVFVS